MEPRPRETSGSRRTRSKALGMVVVSPEGRHRECGINPVKEALPASAAVSCPPGNTVSLSYRLPRAKRLRPHEARSSPVRD
jgi:hypothetical protein